MRNKFLFIFLFIFTAKIFADTTSVASDSTIKPFIPPSDGPLGLDAYTGLALYTAAILFAVLIVALWRRNIVKRKNLFADSPIKHD